MHTKSNIKFSVITVCYNAEKSIQKTIESVLMQREADFEYIIVDGNSEDGTIEIIGAYENDTRVQWYSAPDSGIYNAMNKGIRYANGDYIFFLNAGDEFHKEDVLQEINNVISYSKADIIIGDIAFKTKSGLKPKKYETGERLLELLRSGDSVCHQAIFASNSCLQKGFDERFKICADYDWLCRQVNGGKKFKKANVVITDYDINGISNQIQYQKLHWEECFEVLTKNFPELDMKVQMKIHKLFMQGKKTHILYELMNQWVILKQKQIQVSDFFVRMNVHRIAIYGMHYLGQRLYDELKDSSVEVVYGIDKKSTDKYDELLVVEPSIQLGQVDAIVITPMFDFIEIKEQLRKIINCKMISIEEVLSFWNCNT